MARDILVHSTDESLKILIEPKPQHHLKRSLLDLSSKWSHEAVWIHHHIRECNVILALDAIFPFSSRHKQAFLDLVLGIQFLRGWWIDSCRFLVNVSFADKTATELMIKYSYMNCLFLLSRGHSKLNTQKRLFFH